jgi:hypothetical protein
VTHAWAWLVANGLYKDALATAVAASFARLAAWRPLRRHTQRQELIADLLRTDTPGGMADVLDELKKRGHHGAGPPPSAPSPHR